MPKIKKHTPLPGDQGDPASNIANQYGYPVEEVQAWFDRGYSQGELERAYRMGDEMDCEVSDILAMRDVGMDWREIGKALDAMPDVGGDDDDDSAFGEPPSHHRKGRSGGRR